MTAWIVIICILILLLLVGGIALKLDVHFESGQQPSVVMRVLFFSFVLLPQTCKKQKKKRKKESVPKQQTRSSDESAENQAHAPKEQSNSLADTIELVKQFLTPLPDLLNAFRKGLLFKNVQIHWRVSDSDAAKTALQYAHACQAFYGLLGIADRLFEIDLKQVRIYPDFWNEDPFYSVEFRVQMRVGRIVLSGLKYLFAVLKNLLKIKLTAGKRQNKQI